MFNLISIIIILGLNTSLMIFTSGVAVAGVFLLEARDSRTWMETGGPGNHGGRAILAVGKG